MQKDIAAADSKSIKMPFKHTNSLMAIDSMDRRGLSKEYTTI